jgi:molybdopterin converting factor subunit 1
MKVQVSYFAAFREATGVSSERVDSGAATAAALFDECAGRHPALQRYTASLVAINDEITAWDAALADGDEILFFPPVAGG